MTPRQAEVLEFIAAFSAERGYAPSVREIASGLGTRSSSPMHRHLVALREAGLVEWDPARPRTLRVVA